MSSTAVIYPSGFMGYDIGFPAQKDTASFDDKVNALRTASISAPKDRIFVINLSIESLYKRYLHDTSLVSDADFVSDLLSAAANAFGTNNFYNWCYAQTKTPYFTANHRDFLNDMFRFIMTGRRKYMASVWPSLLKMRLATPEDNRTDYAYREFFSAHSDTMVTDVLASWLSHPYGAEDMLTSLMAIFGRNK